MPCDKWVHVQIECAYHTVLKLLVLPLQPVQWCRIPARYGPSRSATCMRLRFLQHSLQTESPAAQDLIWALCISNGVPRQAPDEALDEAERSPRVSVRRSGAFGLPGDAFLVDAASTAVCTAQLQEAGVRLEEQRQLLPYALLLRTGV